MKNQTWRNTPRLLRLTAFFTGKLFLLCEMNVVVKRVTIAVPFAAMLLDVMSWFVTKSFTEFAYVVASGALMGLWECKYC